MFLLIYPLRIMHRTLPQGLPLLYADKKKQIVDYISQKCPEIARKIIIQLVCSEVSNINIPQADL